MNRFYIIAFSLAIFSFFSPCCAMIKCFNRLQGKTPEQISALFDRETRAVSERTMNRLLGKRQPESLKELEMLPIKKRPGYAREVCWFVDYVEPKNAYREYKEIFNTFPKPLPGSFEYDDEVSGRKFHDGICRIRDLKVFEGEVAAIMQGSISRRQARSELRKIERKAKEIEKAAQDEMSAFWLRFRSTSFNRMCNARRRARDRVLKKVKDARTSLRNRGTKGRSKKSDAINLKTNKMKKKWKRPKKILMPLFVAGPNCRKKSVPMMIGGKLINVPIFPSKKNLLVSSSE